MSSVVDYYGKEGEATIDYNGQSISCNVVSSRVKYGGAVQLMVVLRQEAIVNGLRRNKGEMVLLESN